MEKITFKDLPSTDTPINSTNLNLLQTNTENAINEVLNLVYPIGRGFIDFTDTDYSNYLGFTWVRELVGLTPVGYDADDEDFDTIGVTGGEKMHTLTEEEMPSHSHQFLYSNKKFDGWPASSTGSGNINFYLGGLSSGTLTTIADAGEDMAHNNMPPYKVVAYWKRVA